MRKKKTLKELTLKDNFMFGAVMSDENNCRRLLEMILQIPIERVEVSKEKSIVYHPEYKGVRMDVYAKDARRTHYNVEMQAIRKDELGKRSRYYHSQLDMELLQSGADYSELPNAYVIFICDFDPFGAKKYCYTFENKCTESPDSELQDGCQSIFLSTYGQNEEEVPEELVKFLKFVKADLAESTKDFEDEFVECLQNSIQRVKANRDMEERFMILREMLKEERAEGREEGISLGKAEAVIELLENLGKVPEELHEKIIQETNTSVLKRWLVSAAKAETLEQFLKDM